MSKSYLRILILVVTLGYASHTIAASPIPSDQFLSRASVTQNGTPSASAFIIDSAAIFRIVAPRQRFQISAFPAGSDNVTLDLKPTHSPIDGTTQFIEGTSKGEVMLKAPMFFAFRGKVLGEPNSKVFLSVFDGKLLCSITRESGDVFVLGPAKNELDSRKHILTRETDLLSVGGMTPLNCFAEEISQPNALEPINELLHKHTDNPNASLPLFGSTLLQTDIAIEADSCFFHDEGGNMSTVQGYIASLFAMASVIYEDEANITWHITWLKVWTSGDPYQVKGNAYALEDTVPKYWRAHYANVPRDLAHVMTSIGYGGGGCGYYSLCDTNWSYSVSSPQTGHTYPTFAFTYDAYIVAHEVGHNFSLPHSHTCYWDPPLDTCFTKNDPANGLSLGDACDTLPVTPRRSAGTIMSYCANANYVLSGKDISQFKLAMTFSPKVDSVLRVNAERAQCIQPPSDPLVILLSPRGSETFAGDSIISIDWTYANVDSVSLQYSPDGGLNWSNIVQSIPAKAGNYPWKVPNVSSQRMLIRIEDTKATSVADTSLMFFSAIKVAGVSTIQPNDGIQIITNPTYGNLQISDNNRVGQVAYEICDMTGEVLSSGSFKLDGDIAGIDVASLSSGTYFLRITSPIVQVLSFVHLR